MSGSKPISLSCSSWDPYAGKKGGYWGYSAKGRKGSKAGGSKGSSRQGMVAASPEPVSTAFVQAAAAESGPASSVQYSSGVSANGTTYTGGGGPDSIQFIDSVAQDVKVNMSRGTDTVTFGGTSKLGAGTVVDLGADTAADRLVITNQEIVKGSGLRVLNFENNRDTIEVAGAVYNTRAEAEAAINAIQPGSISFGA